MSVAEQVDRAQLRALFIARLMVGFYLLEILLNLVRPRLVDHEPSLTVLAPVPEGGSGDAQRLFHLPQLVFWAVLVALGIGLVLQFVAMRHPAGSRQAIVLTRAALVALLGPFALIPLTIVGQWLPIALLCVPTTVAALLLINGLQQYTRLPWPVLVSAFAWGALVVWGFARACSSMAYGTVTAYLGQDLAEQTANLDLAGLVSDQFTVLNVVILHLTVLTPLAAAGGVAVLLILLRRQVIDVVTGLAIGAATGLGVTLVESVLFIKLWGSLSSFFTGATGGFEFWVRQVVTLLTGPVTFFALLGAGLAVAFELEDRRRARLLAAASIMAAVGANVANELVTGWLSHLLRPHLAVGGAFDTLIVSPGILLLVEAPFVVLVGLLLRSGLRTRAVRARAALTTEMGSGSGAVTPADVVVLTDPATRAWVTVGAARRQGPAGVRALRRLHRAQLDLGTWHWVSGSRNPEPEDVAERERLRARVLALRSGTVEAQS